MPFRFGPAASVPTSYLFCTKPWMEAWPLGSIHSLRVGWKGCLDEMGIRQAGQVNST